MKKLLVTLAITGLTVGAFAQGKIGYQNTGGSGKEKYVYGVDAANPTSATLGGTRDKVAGTGYSAQLWVGTSEGDMKAIDASLTTFKTGTTAGLIAGNSNLVIPGLLGGTKVVIQLRAWANATGSVTWADVLKDGTIARGQSNIVTGYELSGVDDANVPHAGSGLLANNGLQSFGLYIVTVPEPSVIALGALGLGALVLRRRK